MQPQFAFCRRQRRPQIAREERSCLTITTLLQEEALFNRDAFKMNILFSCMYTAYFESHSNNLQLWWQWLLTQLLKNLHRQSEALLDKSPTYLCPCSKNRLLDTTTGVGKFSGDSSDRDCPHCVFFSSLGHRDTFLWNQGSFP